MYHFHSFVVSSLQRARPEDEGSDDDISIVSRSPSPSLDQMDVDTGFYDDRRRAPEAITVETRIKPENKGFALLAKMGWSEGQPLGLSADGINCFHSFTSSRSPC